MAPVLAEEAPVVVRDLFPVVVTVGGEQHRSARAVITRARVYVWVGSGRDRIPVLEQPYDREASRVPSYHAPPREGADLLLDDGRAVAIRRQRGCGCGSPLRSWQPWQPYFVAAA